MEEYNFDGLTTVAECEATEAEAQLELKEFETQLGNIDLRQGRAENTGAKNTVALTVNRAELQGLEVAKTTVTDANALKSLNNRITKVRNRVENLEVDIQSKGIVKVLKLQLDVKQLEGLIQITKDFITGVQTKKATLA